MKQNYNYQGRGEPGNRSGKPTRNSNNQPHREGNGMKNYFRGPTPSVILFLAPWVGVGKIMHDMLRRIEPDYRGTVRFATINVESEPEARAILNIRQLPTVAFIKDGEVVKMYEGAVNARTIRQTLDRIV